MEASTETTDPASGAVTADGRASPIRVLLCKSGLEEHDRGVRYVARALMDAGMEVVYVVFHDPGEIAGIAVQEDVDVVGISSSAGGHLAVAQTIREDLNAHGAHDVSLLMGGIIPTADQVPLGAFGVVGVFGPGSSPARIVEAIRTAAERRRAALP